LGDANIGKTSLLIRYIDNKYDADILAILGVDIRYKFVIMNNKKNENGYLGYGWSGKI
jgi:GTPase SAR1 family protein